MRIQEKIKEKINFERINSIPQRITMATRTSPHNSHLPHVLAFIMIVLFEKSSDEGKKFTKSLKDFSEVD